jgi:phosphatidylglycerol:prolipoprotein diacylglycerol transferase
MLMFARRRGVSGWDLADFSGTSLPLGHALGRIGCFLNGCCHGNLAPEWLGIAYPADSYPWHQQIGDKLISAHASHSAPVHAVQLYEAVFNLALYAFLVVVYRRGSRCGMVTALYLMLYPVGRFALEFLRADHEIFLGRLTGAQVWGILLFLLGAAIWLWRHRREPTPGAVPRPGGVEALRSTSCD